MRLHGGVRGNQQGVRGGLARPPLPAPSFRTKQLQVTFPMKSHIRAAALVMAAAFALSVCGCATTADQRTGRLPRIETQIEIRDLDALLESIDRLSLPNTSPQQLRTTFLQIGLAIAGVSPFDVVETAVYEPLRIIVWSIPGRRGGSGLILDFPAIGGNTDFVLGKIGASGVYMPRKLGAREAAALPAGARQFHSPALKKTLLALPRGNHVALLDITDLSPASALRLLEEAPPVRAEGFLAIAPNPETLVDNMADRPFAARSVDEFSVGLGIDDEDRLRVSISLSPRPGTPLARLASTVSAPVSPLAGAVLFPSAVAALSVRYSLDGLSDDELLPVYRARTDLSAFVRELAGQGERRVAGHRDALARTQLDLHRLVGCETTAAVFPGTAAVPVPWAILLTDLPSRVAPDEFPPRLEAFLDARLDLLKAVAPSADIASLIGKLGLGIEFAGERTILDIPVRTYALRASNPDNPGQRIDIATFDAAFADGALLLANLPRPALDRVLATLSAGKTSRGPLTALPAFSETAGEAPRNAAAGYIRFRPFLKNLLPAARNLLQATAEEWSMDTSGFPSAEEFDSTLSKLPEVTLAHSCSWLPRENRLSTTVTIPLGDIQAAIKFFRKAASPSSSASRRRH